MAASQSLSNWSVLALTSLLLQFCIWNTGNTARCGTNITALVSGDVYRLNDTQITENPAVESRNGYSPENVRLPDGRGWCSEDLGTNIHDPYLDFNFNTDTVILNYIEITGIDSRNNYVNDIQIETDKYGNGDFEFVTAEQTNIPLILSTALTNDKDRERILLNGTLGLVARIVRVRPYSWSSQTAPCMRLELYGCLADPDSVVPPDTTSQSQRLTNLVLSIALPIALVTLLTVVVISIFSVSCCWYIKIKAERSMKNVRGLEKNMEVENDHTIKHVRNELYQISERHNADLEQTTNSRSEILTMSYPDEGSPRPYEMAVLSQTQEADNDAYYSPVSPTLKQEDTHDLNASRYEVVGGSDTMDSHGYEKVERISKARQHIHSGGKKEGNNDAHAEMAISSLEVPKSQPTNQSDSRYVNVPPSPVDRGFGMSESYGPEPYQV